MQTRLAFDWRFIFLVFCLMFTSLVAISGITAEEGAPFFTPYVISQLKWFGIGWCAFFGMALFDYRKLKNSAWVLYILLVISLVGLFWAPAVHSVHRWYRLPFLGFDMQPSELAKLIVALILAVFVDHHRREMHRGKWTLIAGVIGLVPVLLILKQPDLGTAMILAMMVLAVLYVAGAHRIIMRGLLLGGLALLLFVASIFSGAIDHERVRPYALSVMKEYQYERLMPKGYHQVAAQTAIGVGGLSGKGWRQADYTGGQWLPAAHTDSAFASFGEQFGFAGIIVLIGLFFALLYLGIGVAIAARDPFGKTLALAITAGLGGHILVNMGMMSGLLPITGVPLVLLTYGGSSVLTTMASLGLLQSVYLRRFS